MLGSETQDVFPVDVKEISPLFVFCLSAVPGVLYFFHPSVVSVYEYEIEGHKVIHF